MVALRNHCIHRLKRKIIQSFGSNKTKGTKQYSHNGQRSTMSEGGEP